jgi:hypothetical protein
MYKKFHKSWQSYVFPANYAIESSKMIAWKLIKIKKCLSKGNPFKAGTKLFTKTQSTTGK